MCPTLLGGKPKKVDPLEAPKPVEREDVAQQAGGGEAERKARRSSGTQSLTIPLAGVSSVGNNSALTIPRV